MVRAAAVRARAEADDEERQWAPSLAKQNQATAQQRRDYQGTIASLELQVHMRALNPTLPSPTPYNCVSKHSSESSLSVCSMIS